MPMLVIAEKHNHQFCPSDVQVKFNGSEGLKHTIQLIARSKMQSEGLTFIDLGATHHSLLPLENLGA